MPERLSPQQLHELSELLVDLKADDWVPESEWRIILGKVDGLDADAIDQVCSFARDCIKANTDIELRLVLNSSGHELAPGTVVDRFTVLERLGAGGMGTVYKAQFQASDLEPRFAAIKVGTGLKDFVDRLRAERNLLSRIEHPNVVEILDAGTTPSGLPYFAMKYIDGGVKLGRFFRQTLPLRERLQVFQKICAAASYLHGQGFVHRDLKPANILVTRQGEPKLLDFGLAAFLEPETGAPSFVKWVDGQALFGTPGFMSPQQERGAAPSISDDVYSLGIILRELMEGSTDASKVERERLNGVVSRCLKEDPKERFDSVSGFSQAVSDSMQPRRFVSRILKPATLAYAGLAIVSVGVASFFIYTRLGERSARNAELAKTLREAEQTAKVLKGDTPILKAIKSSIAAPLRRITRIDDESFEVQEREALSLAAKGDQQAKNVLATMYIMCRQVVVGGKAGLETNENYLKADAETKKRGELSIAHLDHETCSREKVDQALTWLRELANTGNPRASVFLANVLYGGTAGIEKNPWEAFGWFRKASEKNDPNAWHGLGVMYWKGDAIPKNEETAFDCFEQAALQGNVNGMFEMARIFAFGWSSKRPKDQFEAYVWTLLATSVRQGFFVGEADPLGLTEKTRQKALLLRADLEKQLSKNQMDLAEKRAAKLAVEIEARFKKYISANYPPPQRENR